MNLKLSHQRRVVIMTSLFLSYYSFLLLLLLSYCSSPCTVVDAFPIPTGGEGNGGQHLLLLQQTKRRSRFKCLILSLKKKEASSSSSSSHDYHHNDQVVDNNKNNNINNIRLNKVFKTTHSRRKADSLIADRRVKVNDKIVEDMGRRVVPFKDQIQLDDRPYLGWEVHHGFTTTTTKRIVTTTSNTLNDDDDDDDHNKNHQKTDTSNTSRRKQQQQQTQQQQQRSSSYVEEYIKYWKPVGITSTTDRTIKSNILDAIENSRSSSCWGNNNNVEVPIKNRIFTVGRLDKDSSGIILLTSDGRVPNAVLRSKFKRPKSYIVKIDKPMKISDLKGLRNGITITTDRVRRGKHEQITAKTLPCKVSIVREQQQQQHNDNTVLKIQLTEGRNRQIRVMLSTLGYNVLELHRDDFMGINLDDIHRPGDWKRLSNDEIQILETAISNAERYEKEKEN